MPKGLLRGFLGGVATGVGKGAEAAGDQYYIQEVMNNPNMSPIQKAAAVSKMAPEVAKQYLKESQTQKLLSDIQSRFSEQQELPQQIPNASQMQEQMAPGPMQAPQGNVQGAFQQAQRPISPTEILQTTAVNPQLGRSLSDVAKMQQRERLETKKEERAVRKETQPVVDQILDTQKTLREDAAVYDQMEALSNTGKLTTPGMNSLLSKAGIPLGVLNNPESEEFDKLSNQLTRTIQNYYGSRILQTEFHNFLRQIPTLQNSEEGRKRIIDNLRKAQIPKQLEYDAYKQVMQENGGKRPVDLKERITEKLIPSLDNWLKDMRQSIDKTLPHDVPSGTLIVIAPNGMKKAIPKDQVANALAQGGKLE